MNEFPKSDNPMPLWLKVMLKESGGEENLANMMIVESPELFTTHQVITAKQKLRLDGWVMPGRSWIKKTPEKKSTRWTAEEDNVLMSLWREMDVPDIARELNRSMYAIYARLTILRNKDLISLKVA